MSKYFKPKSKKIIKMAAFVKGFTGTVGLSALIIDYKWVGIAILVTGAFANEVMNFFSDDTDIVTREIKQDATNKNIQAAADELKS